MPLQDVPDTSPVLPGDDHASSQRHALDELFCLTYQELRRLASVLQRGNSNNTLTPTALVNEAWLKMAKSPSMAAESPLHFKRIAARAMRQLLIEAARRRQSRKRGGNGEAVFVTFDDSLFGAASTPKELLALESAMSELERFEPRQAAIVESRFFGGLEVLEIATLFGISEATVLRDWRSAKAWLGQKISKSQ